MPGNGGCLIEGCPETVIGHCSCGKQYCRRHGHFHHGKEKTLCEECVNREASREAKKKIQQDYLQTAEKIQKLRNPGAIMFFCMVYAIGLFVFAHMSTIHVITSLFPVLLFLPMPIVIWWAIMQNMRVARAIADAEKIQPGFRIFYQANYESTR